MANLYANRIERETGQVGAFSINDVPNLWKTSTLTKLKERGLDGNGNLLTT